MLDDHYIIKEDKEKYDKIMEKGYKEMIISPLSRKISKIVKGENKGCFE